MGRPPPRHFEVNNMPRIISKRFAGQTLALTDAAVRFDDDGNAVGIVRRGTEWLSESEPLDEAVIAKARKMSDHFTVVEDEEPEELVVEPPTSCPTIPDVEPEPPEAPEAPEEAITETTPAPLPANLSALRKPRLVALARLRGINTDGLTAKQIVAALEASEA